MEDQKTTRFSIKGERHAAGNVISECLRMRNPNNFCAYRVPHPMLDSVIIECDLDISSVQDAITDLVGVYEHLLDGLKKTKAVVA